MNGKASRTRQWKYATIHFALDSEQHLSKTSQPASQPPLHQPLTITMSSDEYRSVEGAAELATQRILQNVLTLFNNPDYADFTIKCGGRQWSVHKAIICPHSKFFAAVCRGPFQV